MGELVAMATGTVARDARIVRVSTASGTSPFDPPSDDRIERVLARRADPFGFCVTVVSGATADEVRRAFGAERPGMSLLSLAGGVVVVEDGGSTGTESAVLRAASRWGRAAGYYCSGAGQEVLGFAEFGELLESGVYRLPDERPSLPRLSVLVDEVAAATGDHLLLPVLVLERFVGLVIDEPTGDRHLTELRHRD